MALDAVSSTVAQPALFPLADVVASLVSGQPAVAAEVGGEMVGVAVGRVDRDRGWILRMTLHPQWRGKGLGSELLAQLEQRLVAAGAHRLTCALPHGETGSQALLNSGFVPREDVTWFEKLEQVRTEDVEAAAALGGVIPPSNLWTKVKGVTQEKAMIDRRVVLPLAHRGLAEEHGVREPRAVMLFGPPGTGKTTFARAIASRLSWPFVALFPHGWLLRPAVWQAACPTPSPPLPGWTTSWCSSTRWRRSPPTAPRRGPTSGSSTSC